MITSSEFCDASAEQLVGSCNETFPPDFPERTIIKLEFFN